MIATRRADPVATVAYRGRMRSTSLALTVVAIAACGGKAATTPSTPAPAPAPTAPGTSGFPGLDWGATVPAVQAIYPSATGDEGLSFKTTLGGEPASVSLVFFEGELERIAVEFDRGFDSMGECSKTFASVRAALALGESSEENLAAHWIADSYSAILSCNIADGEAASMSMSYGHPEQ